MTDKMQEQLDIKMELDKMLNSTDPTQETPLNLSKKRDALSDDELEDSQAFPRDEDEEDDDEDYEDYLMDEEEEEESSGLPLWVKLLAGFFLIAILGLGWMWFTQEDTATTDSNVVAIEDTSMLPADGSADAPVATAVVPNVDDVADVADPDLLKQEKPDAPLPIASVKEKEVSADTTKEATKETPKEAVKPAVAKEVKAPKEDALHADSAIAGEQMDRHADEQKVLEEKERLLELQRQKSEEIIKLKEQQLKDLQEQLKNL